MRRANQFCTLRPAALAHHVVWLPLAGLTLGACVPPIADAARPALGPAAMVVVFACVGATRIAPPNRAEIRTVLLMILTTCVACPAIAGMLALMARLPADLALVAGLAAASPVAVGAGSLCHYFGLPERPAVWAALGGLAIGPVLLPAVAAAIIATQGGPVAIAVHSLAERAALFGALPAAAAFLFRRAAPHKAAALAPDLRGVAVVGLCLLALCAGGTIAPTIRVTDPDEGSALLVIAAAILFAAGTTWAAERVAPTDEDPMFGRELLVVSGARNISFVWASAVAALTPRGQAVLAVAVAGTFVMPAAVFIASRVATAARTRVVDIGRAGAVPARWLATLGALATCWVVLLLNLPSGSTTPNHLLSEAPVLGQPVRPSALPVIIAGHDASRRDAYAGAAAPGPWCERHFVRGARSPSPRDFQDFLIEWFMAMRQWPGAGRSLSKGDGQGCGTLSAASGFRQTISAGAPWGSKPR
jgi:hypothetical protein